MTDNFMGAAIACAALVAIIYRIRRDITGPTLTTLSEAASWVSLGALIFWIGADWLTGSTDQWFTTIPGSLALASIEAACLLAMVLDVMRGRKRHARSGRHRAS